MHKPQESSILYILNIAGSAGSKMLMMDAPASVKKLSVRVQQATTE